MINGTLTPAYGRDYRSKKEVEADFRAGKDFVLNNPWQQTYCSIRDFQPGETATIRFGRPAKVHVVKV